jgi:hypothetical protein
VCNQSLANNQFIDRKRSNSMFMVSKDKTRGREDRVEKIKPDSRLINYILDPLNMLSSSPIGDILNPRRSKWLATETDMNDDKWPPKIRMGTYEGRMTILTFYFDDNFILTITRDAKTNFEAKVALIGGTLGLFTGFSFVSLYEMFYLIYKVARDFFSNLTCCK